MKIIEYPLKESWPELCFRPSIDKNDLEDTVRDILKKVKAEKDAALFSFSLKFGGVCLDRLKVTGDEIVAAENMLSDELKASINKAKENIEKFHRSQLHIESSIETLPGVKCWRKNLPIEKVGLYIPGGSAPLFSTLLMLGVPAKIAGCNDIIVCTPAGRDGRISPQILYTAAVTGINDIYKIGGAQAIAAMAYGTESVPAIDKIFGPGNQYVTKAKELIQQEGVAIDMPAGPSEVLVIADEQADAEFVAADLLSQAEHGPDSQVILLTDSLNVIDKVKMAVARQVEALPRKGTALAALENSMLILFSSPDDCISFSNLYAPEHLIINTADPYSLVEKVVNAGSVFIGKYSCESMGDYASGTNHTLPTNGYSKSYSGVSVESFMKKITFQEINETGLFNLGPVVRTMAKAEFLEGHGNAVTVRLKKLSNG
jgi:histidinol dehydrogenase